MKKERNNKITSNFLRRNFINNFWTAQIHYMYPGVYVLKLKNNETVLHFLINFILLNIFFLFLKRIYI